jgi:hypothetical protein
MVTDDNAPPIGSIARQISARDMRVKWKNALLMEICCSTQYCGKKASAALQVLAGCGTST